MGKDLMERTSEGCLTQLSINKSPNGLSCTCASGFSQKLVMKPKRTSSRSIYNMQSLKPVGFNIGLGVLVAVALLLSPVVGTKIEQNDIQNYLIVLEGSEATGDAAVAKQPLSETWGLPDATAVVGKLFEYKIPQEAFNENVAAYKVKEAEKDKLPSWLTYVDDIQTIKGVPRPEDVGSQFLIEIVAKSQFLNNSSTDMKDIFTLSVIKEEEENTPSSFVMPSKEKMNNGKMKPIKCSQGASVTMATVIMDVELDVLGPSAKIDIMDNMCKHLGLSHDLLSLLPVGNKPMFDSSALVAGPGDVKQPKYSGAVLQWVVGCGNVHADHMPILQQVESTSSDGSMADSVGHGVIGWHVTNNKLQAPQRMKRQVHFMPTQTIRPTVSPPTRQPVPTVIVDHQTDLPVTRVVPTMASPTFPEEIKPTKSHKHHHRTKTRGRHHHKTKHPKQSPKMQHTKTPKTVMPTPTVQPIQPTRVIDITPTVIDASLGRVSPTMGVASPGVSRTGVVIEPSMTQTKPVRTEGTEPLPSRTYTMPFETSKDVIYPTKTDDHEATTEPWYTKPKTTKKPITTQPPTIPDEEFNYAPILKEDITRLDVVVGNILEYKIPNNTFWDVEDGGTENLKLIFVAVDGLSLPRDSWVKFNQTSQTLYGLPLPQHEGRQEVMIAAIDNHGKIARDAFEIVVQRRPHEQKISHEFSMTLDLDYQKFLTDVSKRVEVAHKLARAFGDSDASKITVTRIAPGSVVYSWTNNSVPSGTCPTRQIGDMLRYIVTPNETLNQTFVDAMKPYKVLKAGVEPRGSCVEDMPPVQTNPDDDSVDGVPRESTDEEVLITTVVPAVIIVCMLLIATCIACIFYRKRRKGKLTYEDQHTFINKGIPIIFADELEDKPDPPSKPLIMEEEKPPLPPPEYHRSGSLSPPSSPNSDHKEPITEDEQYESDLTQPLYQPPPPFTTGSGGRRHHHQRPRPQPAYRNPPPYVPP